MDSDPQPLARLRSEAGVLSLQSWRTEPVRVCGGGEVTHRERRQEEL